MVLPATRRQQRERGNELAKNQKEKFTGR